jgi:hypothetical protein
VAAFILIPAGLSPDAAGWEQTPLVRHLVLHLLGVIQQRQTAIQHLEARIQTLEVLIVELEARWQQRSGNSECCPSSDPPYEKRIARSPSPYQFAAVIIVRRVVEAVKIFSSVDSLLPFLWERPFCLGFSGGAGS